MSKVKGNLYRTLRKESGKTQVEIGNEVGLDHTTIAKIEAGERSISHKLIPKLARALGVPIARLVSWSDPPLCATKIPKSDIWQPEEVSQFCFVMGDVSVGKGARLGHFVVLDGTRGRVTVADGTTVTHGTVLIGPCRLNADGSLEEGLTEKKK